MSSLQQISPAPLTLKPIEREARPAQWRRFRSSGVGVTFEVPFAMTPADGRGEVMEKVASGSMLVPFVFEVAFLASNGPLSTSVEELARETAVRWTIDYEFVSPPAVRRARYASVDEAWVLTAKISDPAGTLSYTWVTLEVDERIYCIGISYWAHEQLAKETCDRILRTISGPITWV